MMRRLEDALQDCLAALTAGQATVEECLARYPDLAADLEPLLRMGQRLQEVYKVSLSPVYAQAARQRFLAALAIRRRRVLAGRHRRVLSRQQGQPEVPAGPRHRNRHRPTASISTG